MTKRKKISKRKHNKKSNPAVTGLMNIVFPFGSPAEQILTIGKKNFLLIEDLGYAFDSKGNILGMLRSYIHNDNTQIIGRGRLPKSLELNK